jgi:hypothetical protein
MKCLTLVLPAAFLTAFLISAPARADDTLDQAYGFGQFAGAASFCGVPRADVMDVAGKLLKAVGIDPSSTSPEMTRFTEGVADGTSAMKEKDAPDCAEVKTAFAEAQSKLK